MGYTALHACVVLGVLLMATSGRAAENPGGQRVSFNRDVRPILSDRC